MKRKVVTALMCTAALGSMMAMSASAEGKLIGYTVATFFIGCIAYIAYLMLLKLMRMCKSIFIKFEDV